MNDLNIDPAALFVYSMAFGALAAVGALLKSSEPVTLRSVAAAIIFHGTVAGALAICAYEGLSWQKYPLRCFGLAIFWGAGLISVKWIQEIIKSNVSHVRLPDSDEHKDS
jgi:hypothetical protein